jgi:hypothetical protein
MTSFVVLPGARRLPSALFGRRGDVTQLHKGCQVIPRYPELRDLSILDPEKSREINLHLPSRGRKRAHPAGLRTFRQPRETAETRTT